MFVAAIRQIRPQQMFRAANQNLSLQMLVRQVYLNEHSSNLFKYLHLRRKSSA